MGRRSLVALLVIVIVCAHTSTVQGAVKPKSGSELMGYWENWNDVSWWENNIPGNCLMGCVKPQAFMQFMKDYSSMNYGFTFLTKNPDPDRIDCQNSPANCPVWDNTGIYIAHASMNGATVVNDAITIHNVETSPGLIAIAETCRLARQGPYGPRRCKISLGGWSDWARLGSVANAQHLGVLVAKMILLSFADGVDLDFEHLTEFGAFDDEFTPFIALVQSIRSELNKITSSVWSSTAQTRYTDLQNEYNAMPDWQKKESYYYPTNMQYMQDLQKNPVPYFEITWTTRFNAFINASAPFDYLAPGSPIPPQFPTSNEGTKFWKQIAGVTDMVNIMAYDGGSPAGPLKLNFQQILQNFVAYGPVPKTVINMGFEPGDQYGGGVWEGADVDMATIKYVKAQGFGGAMFWSINPTSANSSHWVPIVTASANTVLQPQFPYPPVPTYTKCDPTTGWINSKDE